MKTFITKKQQQQQQKIEMHTAVKNPQGQMQQNSRLWRSLSIEHKNSENKTQEKSDFYRNGNIQ